MNNASSKTVDNPRFQTTSYSNSDYQSNTYSTPSSYTTNNPTYPYITNNTNQPFYNWDEKTTPTYEIYSQDFYSNAYTSSLRKDSYAHVVSTEKKKTNYTREELWAEWKKGKCPLHPNEIIIPGTLLEYCNQCGGRRNL